MEEPQENSDNNSKASLLFKINQNGEQKDLNISDLENICKDQNVNLMELLKNGAMNVNWPFVKPKPTGNVRAQLIHTRMHQKPLELGIVRETNPTSLGNLSSIFTLIITIPAVAYSLYFLLRWLGYSKITSMCFGIIGGVVSFIVEISITLLRTFKQESTMQKQMKGNNLDTKTSTKKPTAEKEKVE